MFKSEILVLSEAEEKWVRTMQEACNEYLQKVKDRPLNDSFLMEMAKTFFDNRKLKLPWSPRKFGPYTTSQKGAFPIQGFFWGFTAEEHPAALSFYKKGIYRPHAHGAAWVLVVSGGGSGFHYDERFPNCSEWLDLRPGKIVNHGDGIFHGYKMNDSLVLAIGARPVTGNERDATQKVMRAFNRRFSPING